MVVAYYLDVPRDVCLDRNRRRTGRSRVPVAIHVTGAKLVPPGLSEGFDAVFRVDPAGEISGSALAPIAQGTVVFSDRGRVTRP